MPYTPTQVRDAGRQARKIGLAREKNPFMIAGHEGMLRAFAWFEGWDRADRLERMDWAAIVEIERELRPDPWGVRP